MIAFMISAATIQLIAKRIHRSLKMPTTLFQNLGRIALKMERSSFTNAAILVIQ